MQSPSTPLREVPASSRKLDDNGFSLLEVIVALAIMAIGYITVLNLFSVSINSVGMSDQYMTAVRLANSKLSELEMMNYEVETLSGTFENEESFQWSMELEPYESPLNNPKKNINLSQVILKVFWEDNQKPRTVELATLKLDGTTSPAPDSLLAKVFSGGITPSSQDSAQSPDSPQTPGSTPGSPGSTPPRESISGAGSGGISGAGSSFHVSGF